MDVLINLVTSKSLCFPLPLVLAVPIIRDHSTLDPRERVEQLVQSMEKVGLIREVEKLEFLPVRTRPLARQGNSHPETENVPALPHIHQVTFYVHHHPSLRCAEQLPSCGNMANHFRSTGMHFH